MLTIVVDDERLMRQAFCRHVEKIELIEICGVFEDGESAAEFAEKNYLECAFIDVELGDGMNGVELALKLRSLYPQIILVFLTAYGDYLKAANRLGVDYYLLKPYKHEEILAVTENLSYLYRRTKPVINIRTQGKFSVSVNGSTVKFASKKAKELLACLVDRNGEFLSEEEGFSCLWEHLKYSHNNAGSYRLAVKKLLKTLKEYRIENLVICDKKQMAIDKNLAECDAWLLFGQDKDALRNFRENYMEEYAWAEYTNAAFTGEKYRLLNE